MDRMVLGHLNSNVDYHGLIINESAKIKELEKNMNELAIYYGKLCEALNLFIEQYKIDKDQIGHNFKVLESLIQK